MGESAKTKSVRLTQEHRDKILEVQEYLSPFAGDESDVIRLAIEHLHAEVVRDASAVLQRLHCNTLHHDTPRLRPWTLQQWLERCAQNKQKGAANGQ